MHARLACRHALCGLPSCVLALLLTLAGPSVARAAKEQFQRSKPHVNVASTGQFNRRGPDGALETIGFEADARTGPGESSHGYIRFTFPDGSRREFQAVAGRVEEHRDSEVVALLLLPLLPSGDVDALAPAVAVARHDARADDLIVWEISGTSLATEPLRFESAGRIHQDRGAKPDPAALPWFSLHYKPQGVTIVSSSGQVEAKFSASARVTRDHTARGRVQLDLHDGGTPLRLDPVFGSVAPRNETGPAYIIILMALEGAPLRRDNLFLATIHQDPSRAGNDVWDLSGIEPVSNGLDAFHVTFPAVGWFRIQGPPLQEQAPTFSSLTEAAIGEPDPNPDGPWSLSNASDGDWRAHRGGTWSYLGGWFRRRMSASFLVEGDRIPVAILFSAEARVDGSGKRLFVRLLVDGQPMHPGDVALAAGETGDRRATQSFEFTGTYDRGLHTVDVEWIADEGGSGFIRGASLLIRQGNSSTVHPLLVAVTPDSGVNLETGSSDWEDVPGLQADIATPDERSRLCAVVSAEAYASAGNHLHLRVLVDGVVAEPGLVDFATGRFEGTHSMVFGVPEPARGNHHVRVQWRASQGGTAGLGDRTLVLSVLSSANSEPVRGYLLTADSETHPTGAYTPVPGMTQNLVVGEDSDLAAVFAVEFPDAPTARVWARLSIGGVPVPGSEVLLANAATSAGVHASVFDAKHVGAGTGSLFGPVRVEWRTEGVAGGLAAAQPTIHARSLSLLIREHVAPDLAESPSLGLGISYTAGMTDNAPVNPANGTRQPECPRDPLRSSSAGASRPCHRGPDPGLLRVRKQRC